MAKRKPKGKPVRDLASPPPVITLRPHQLEAKRQFELGKRDQYHIWNRRAGKDWFGLDVAASCARKEIGTYWHLLPKHIQAKRAIWNGIDHQTGKRFIELFFPDAISINNTEMLVELECGSTWQLLGSDNYDRMVGSNPRGVIYSEWALCDPRARDYIQPILRANKGWAIYITTFRGRGHAYQMYNLLKDNPAYYVTLLTVDDTKTVTPEDIEADRKAGMSERRIQEEYYCKPVAPVSLGPYARTFDSVEQLGNIRDLPESAAVGAINNLSVGYSVNGQYAAVLHCISRGGNHHLKAGKIEQNASVNELLDDYMRSLITGNAQLAAAEEIDDEIIQGLHLPKPSPRQATRVETMAFLERATISPTSVVTAALTGGLNVYLDEDADEESATQAVYDALERLAGIATQSRINNWGPKPDYTIFDKAVIGRMQ